MSQIPSKDATMDQVHEPTLGAEAKQSTQNNDKAIDTEWTTCPRRVREKNQKKQTRLKLRQQHLYTRDDEQMKSQQSFDFVQIVC